MKRLITILFLFFSLFASAGKPSMELIASGSWITGARYFTLHELEFPSNGLLTINPTNYPSIAPGDVVYLRKGSAASVAKVIEFQDMNGSAVGGHITFQNDPNEQLVLNNTSWVLADGFGTAIKTERCSYLVIKGVGFSNEGIWIRGPTAGDHHAFFGVQILDRSHHIEVAYIGIDDGGTGVQFKTFVTSNSATWYPNTTLEDLYFHHIRITSVNNEGFYGGSTDVYTRHTTGTIWQPAHVTDPIPSPQSEYKQALVYTNVTVHNITVTGSGNDAMQFAACDSLTVYNCEVTDWAQNYHPDDNPGHQAAVLIGGRVTNSNVYNFVAQNSTNGEGVWHFAEGPNHKVSNLLIYNVLGNLLFIKGGKHLVENSDYQCVYENMTLCKSTWSGAVGIRNNGIMGGTAEQLFNNSLIIEPGDGGFGGGSSNPRYIYVENGGQVTEGTGSNANGKYNLVSAAGIDVNNFCQPIEPSSPIDDEGYRSPVRIVNRIVKRAGRSRYKLIQQ